MKPADKAYLTEPASIQDAYEELSQEAFAVWIRMMLMTDSDLVGRQKIAKLLGYSEGRSNAILRELKLKSYIFIERPDMPGEETIVKIRRRAVCQCSGCRVRRIRRLASEFA